MKRIPHTLSALAVIGVLTLSGCGASSNNTEGGDASSSSAAQAENSKTVSVEDNFGTHDVQAPVKAAAVTDNRSFELVDKWGVDVVAAPKQLVPTTIPGIKNDQNIVDLGTHREPDLEALASAEPDVILNGQRFSQHYKDIQELNPEATLLEFEPRDGEPMLPELKRHTTALGEVFGKQDDAKQLVSDLDQATEAAKKAYDPQQKVIAINVSGGEMGYIAPGKGRFFGPLFDELNLTPALQVENASDDHEGDDISVEAIAKANPDWILVLDRDAAVSKDPNVTPAKEVIMNSEALKNVTAVKKGNIVVAPADTYYNENIITYTEVLTSMKDAFEKA
ncbi:ABC transporter substrate-binding protein [Rothia sp. LK2588]|uniref:siderophore ABC transporter substrate-binding protein n=1 Tax=Rothia sp. LK2588 TaxID=3114369 RepID=UPI0034CFB2CA